MYLKLTDLLVPVNIYLLLLFSAVRIHAPPYDYSRWTEQKLVYVPLLIMHLINHCRRPRGRAIRIPKLEASPKPHPPASRSINTLSTGEIDYDALALERTVKCYSSKPTRNTSTVSRLTDDSPLGVYGAEFGRTPFRALR